MASSFEGVATVVSGRPLFDADIMLALYFATAPRDSPVGTLSDVAIDQGSQLDIVAVSCGHAQRVFKGR